MAELRPNLELRRLRDAFIVNQQKQKVVQGEEHSLQKPQGQGQQNNEEKENKGKQQGGQQQQGKQEQGAHHQQPAKLLHGEAGGEQAQQCEEENELEVGKVGPRLPKAGHRQLQQLEGLEDELQQSEEAKQQQQHPEEGKCRQEKERQQGLQMQREDNENEELCNLLLLKQKLLQQLESEEEFLEGEEKPCAEQLDQQQLPQQLEYEEKDLLEEEETPLVEQLGEQQVPVHQLGQKPEQQLKAIEMLQQLPEIKELGMIPCQQLEVEHTQIQTVGSSRSAMEGQSGITECASVASGPMLTLPSLVGQAGYNSPNAQDNAERLAAIEQKLKWISGRDAPDSVFAGYPANPKAGYRISGRILDFASIFLVNSEMYL
jgi:hypothetical protein